MVSLCPVIALAISLVVFCSSFSRGDETDDLKKDLKKRAYSYRNDSEAYSDPCTPRHVHISFGNKTGDMQIMWATISLCEDCQVNYGMNSTSMESRRSVSKYINFIKHNKKGLQHLYVSELQDLEPDTVYFYSPVCGSNPAGPYYFHVPPNTTEWAADYLVFGDMGMQTQSIDKVVQEAQSGHYTAVIHAGDIAYTLTKNGGEVGDAFMSMIEPAASFVPYLTCPGNHEMEKDDQFTHYRHRFSMPNSDWPTPLDKMWYSIDIGPVHFISYSSEVFFTNKRKYVKTQEEWLLRDLELANSRRTVTPWIIAFGHRPMYCSTRIDDDCSLEISQVRLGLEKIFYEGKVDIVLEAHEHNYERLWPLYQGNITDYSYTNVSSPIQIISGAAGSHYGTDHFTRGDRPKWSAFRVGEPSLNSYGRMLVQNRTHIWWEQRSALDHTVIDRLWIIKGEGFVRSFNIKYVVPVKEDYHVVVGILVLCISTIALVLVVRSVIQKVRRKRFEKNWHAPLAQDDDLEDDEEEEFSQHSYSTSLI